MHIKNQGFQGKIRVKESSGLTGSGVERDYCNTKFQVFVATPITARALLMKH